MLPNKWWVRITVSTRDSQSRNRSSILLPTTKFKRLANDLVSLFCFVELSELFWFVFSFCYEVPYEKGAFVLFDS